VFLIICTRPFCGVSEFRQNQYNLITKWYEGQNVKDKKRTWDIFIWLGLDGEFESFTFLYFFYCSLVAWWVEVWMMLWRCVWRSNCSFLNLLSVLSVFFFFQWTSVFQVRCTVEIGLYWIGRWERRRLNSML